MVALRISSPWVLLTWLSFPLALRWARFIYNEEGRPLNLALAGTGQLELIFGLLFGAGLIVGA
jgi:1,4-dihydroxy-2-naphthoate octaprenyltransferase